MDIFDPVVAVTSQHPSIDRWTDHVNLIAPKYGVPPNLVLALMLSESGGDPNIIGGSGRGLGLMQIDYGTEYVNGRWQYAGPNGTTTQIFDPTINIMIACRDFIAPSMKAFPANLDAVVCSYNAGVGAVESAIAKGRDLATVTFASWYIPRVRDAFSWLNQNSHKEIA